MLSRVSRRRVQGSCIQTIIDRDLKRLDIHQWGNLEIGVSDWYDRKFGYNPPLAPLLSVFLRTQLS